MFIILWTTASHIKVKKKKTKKEKKRILILVIKNLPKSKKPPEEHDLFKNNSFNPYSTELWKKKEKSLQPRKVSSTWQMIILRKKKTSKLHDVRLSYELFYYHLLIIKW